MQEDWVLCKVFNKSGSEAAGKATSNIGINDQSCDDNMKMGSSTLPPLVDSYINYDQNEAKVPNEYHEQVSCFSNTAFPPNPSNLIFPHIPINMEEPDMLSNKTTTTTTTSPIFGDHGMPDLGTFSCDKMVIKAVLNQISNVEEYSTSFGEGCSSESYLSEVGMGLPNIWNHYC